MSLDNQQVEITGRSLLASVFVSEDIEVAEPLRDNGIDLVIYSNLINSKFNSVPIQLKAATGESFSIRKKYQKFPYLYMAYVWNVSDPQNSSIYILLHSVAVEIATKHGYTKSKSWKDDGKYDIATSVSRDLKESLNPHKYAPGNMHKLIPSLQDTTGKPDYQKGLYNYSSVRKELLNEL